MSLLTRALGTAARGSVVALGTAAAASYIVGRDQQTGSRPAVPDHPGPYSPEERAEAVRTYLKAIEFPTLAFTVPFAPDCVRVENGVRTGFNATHLHWDLHLHLQYAAIRRITDVEITVDPDGREGVVHADFTIVTVLGLRVRVVEDFHVPADDCLIHRIEAAIRPRSPGSR